MLKRVLSPTRTSKESSGAAEEGLPLEQQQAGRRVEVAPVAPPGGLPPRPPMGMRCGSGAVAEAARLLA